SQPVVIAAAASGTGRRMTAARIMAVLAASLSAPTRLLATEAANSLPTSAITEARRESARRLVFASPPGGLAEAGGRMGITLEVRSRLAKTSGWIAATGR